MVAGGSEGSLDSVAVLVCDSPQRQLLCQQSCRAPGWEVAVVIATTSQSAATGCWPGGLCGLFADCRAA